MTERQRRTRKPAKVEEKPTGIILDKKFRLMPLDDQNITLEERVKIGKKPGEKEAPVETKYRWDLLSYHGSHKSAIRAYCTIRMNRAKNENELMTIIADIHKRIDNFFEFKCDGKKKENGCKCST